MRRITLLLVFIAFLPVNLALAQAGYGGPAISGVPSMSSGARAGRPDGISYFAGATGSYDAGITPVSVDSSGNLVQTGALWGASVNWGLFGRHRGRHYMLGVDYLGAYRHYGQNTYYNGLDSVLGMDIVSQLSPRLQWFASTQAGSVASTYGGWTAYTGFLPGVAPSGVPLNEIYDNRNYFVVHNEALTYMLSARMAVTVGGIGTFIRRQSSALAGSEGYGGYSTLSYRLNGRNSVSLSYAWNHYDYTHRFGEATVNELLTGFARRLSRRWKTQVAAGAFRVATSGLISLPADPAVVALFGQRTVIERYNTSVYYPSVSAGLEGNFRRYGLMFAYSRRPSPGNGVYLASSSQGASASATYTGVLHWNFGANVYYSQLRSVAQSIGSYSIVSGGVGASYHMFKNLNATFRADARTWQVDQRFANYRPSYRVQVGMAWSPSDLPLSLW